MRTRFVFAVLLLSCAMCVAQEIAVKDLTAKVAPVRLKEVHGRCFSQGYHVSDGVVLGGSGILEVEIVAVEPRPIVEGKAAIVTARVKNVGKGSAEVPWNEDVASVSNSSSSELKSIKREYAELTLRIPYDNGLGVVKGYAALYAIPGEAQQHLSLEPGEWAELRFTAVAECHNGSHCAAKSDPRASLVAEWRQWTSFEERDANNCVSQSGSYFVSERISKAYQVDIVPVASK